MTHPTAKELDDIYAPAWEVAPESRPKGLYFGSEDVGDNVALMWLLDNDPFALDRPDIPVQLCRMAAIEWLRSKGKVVLSPRFDGAYPEDAEYVKITLPEPLDELMRQPVYLRTGPTLDHALAAAVIAVGGRK